MILEPVKLTACTVPRVRCAAVAGPANNQLDEPCHRPPPRGAGILWAPDVVVGAGGVTHATGVELRQESEARLTARIDGIAAAQLTEERVSHGPSTTHAMTTGELTACRTAGPE
ncbi:hypothetical protein ACIRU3_25825 [Streptomyces sp. NPDC101151]|uniref:hypothetical protein n=1 Tax=Streptomyces sp. NPDC101151 TaxID=3366115 RepID=UPI0037F8E8F9